MATAAVLYWLLRLLSLPLDVRTVCVFVGPFFAGNTVREFGGVVCVWGVLYARRGGCMRILCGWEGTYVSMYVIVMHITVACTHEWISSFSVSSFPHHPYYHHPYYIIPPPTTTHLTPHHIIPHPHNPPPTHPLCW